MSHPPRSTHQYDCFYVILFSGVEEESYNFSKQWSPRRTLLDLRQWSMMTQTLKSDSILCLTNILECLLNARHHSRSRVTGVSRVTYDPWSPGCHLQVKWPWNIIQRLWVLVSSFAKWDFCFKNYPITELRQHLHISQSAAWDMASMQYKLPTDVTRLRQSPGAVQIEIYVKTLGQVDHLPDLYH